MKPEESIPLVTIIAFGCDHYDQLQQLSKVKEDLQRVKEVFCSSSYSVFPEKRFIEVYDKTSFELRAEIQHYLFDRSADQDILILYFSGHGTAIGRDDFGFCMKDAVLHHEDNIILPTSVVKLSEIVGSLNIKNISLMLFVDSCYSGQISKQIKITFPEITVEMTKTLVAYTGSFFGLVSSCSSLEQIYDIGVISKGLKDISEQGSEENILFLPFGCLPEQLTERIDSHSKGDTRSRIFIPPGRISNLPLCKNVQYREPLEPVNIYSFTNPYLKLLLTLWNDGKPIELSPNEILEKTSSQSAYANHKKLSFSPWDLVKNSRNGKRKLTQRGIDFITGNLVIPKFIKENRITRICIPSEGSPGLSVYKETDLLKINHYKLVEFPIS
ncbi:MAG: hypothetical protein CVU43_02410 [Chloroflexi bacterium HGW-Chloroflexi-5]|jgi:hypothetical protein|nr:MAG: hypothetical protein CVU43_02410 [Chloroflexi bacterium HGW-Chloroflexi-5]